MPAAVWLLLFLLAPQGRGTPSSSRTNGVTITGTVIRADAAAGNQGLPNTRVELRPGGFANTLGSSSTFTFRDVQPGRYTLVPHHEGLVVQENPAKSISPIGMTITVNAGQNLSNITLPMIPAPAISGYVFHPNGEPIAAAVVEAYNRRYTPYGRQLSVIKKILTNDLGEYRLYWLDFGEYLVTASYSDRAQRSARQGIRLSANVPKPDDGYATMYYDKATSPADARTARLMPGADSSNVNVFLSDIPRYKINGRIVSASTLPADLILTFAAAGSDLNADRDYSIPIGGNGAFEITGVSPGSYVLLAASSEFSSDLTSLAVANSDVANVSMPLYPTLTLNGHVSTEGRPGGTPAGLRIKLFRTQLEVNQLFETRTSAAGSFVIPGLGHGSFDLTIDGLQSNTYIKSIRFFGQGADALYVPMQIATLDTSSVVDVVLGSTASIVEGGVADNAGKPAAGAQVVLVPEARLRHRTDRYLTSFSDAAGTFQLPSVPPGAYTAFAFEHIETGAYFAFAYDARVNQLFGNRGVPVTVTESGRTTLQLKMISAADTAGGFQ